MTKKEKNLVQPQLFASVFLQFLPGGVGLFDDFLGGGNIEVLLVESERVERLVIRGLVPSEPFADSVLDSGRDIINVVVFLGKRVVNGNGDNLPVQFTVVNHGQDTKRLDFLDGSHLEGGASDFDNIDRIVITEASQFRVLDVGVFPSLWKASCYRSMNGKKNFVRNSEV